MRNRRMFCIFILFIPVLLRGELTLLTPTGGEVLIRGAQYHIQWWGPAGEGAQKVTVFLESASANQFWILDDTHSKADGGFLWTVGLTKDGSTVSPGQYTLTLESLDGDALGKPLFTIIAPVSPYWKRIEKIRKIPRLPPDPGCRGCIRLDLRELKQILGQPRERYVLSLFQETLLLARLGEFGAGKTLPDFALVKNMGRSMGKRTARKGFTLQFTQPKGEPVHSQNVLLTDTKGND